MLAFADTESREYVRNFIEDLRLPGVSLSNLSDPANNKINIEDIKNKRELTVSRKFTKNEDSNLVNEDVKSVWSWNIQFHRQYKTYCFLEVRISPEVDFYITDIIKSPLKYLKILYIKLFLQEKNTAIIVEKILSSGFKKYKY